MIHNEPSIVQKVQPKFFCKVCDYSTCRNSQYERHLSTKKHIEITEGLQNSAYKFNCICGNKYTKRQNLYRHRKTCQVIEKNTEETPKSSEENITIEISEKKPDNTQQMNENFIIEFIKQNNDININGIAGINGANELINDSASDSDN